jgi:CheY-like chemotaxis protein
LASAVNFLAAIILDTREQRRFSRVLPDPRPVQALGTTCASRYGTEFDAAIDPPHDFPRADHPVLRAGLKQILLAEADVELAGEATNSSEALELAQRTDPNVVILDLTLPGSSGLELLKHLRREYPTIPVLVISAHAEDQFAVQVLKAGGAGYLCNDTAPESLVAAVRKIVGGGKYVSAALAEQLAQ